MTAPALFQHQRDALQRMQGKRAFALLMEQGTGKTRVLLEDAQRLYLSGDITGLLVLAPNGVHRNWAAECAQWLTVPHACHVWGGASSKREQADLERICDMTDALAVLAVNIEAVRTARGEKWLGRFLRQHRALMAVDESTRIKSPSAKQTKAAIRLAKFAAYRRILTGTPVTQGPLDIWAQFQFLAASQNGCPLLGHKSFYAFRNRYAVTRQRAIPGRRPFVEVVGYQRLDELRDLIAPHSYRVTKDECLDLPAKIYQRIPVELAPAQRRAYDAIRAEVRAELAGGDVTTMLALTKLLRLQQVIGGFVSYDDGRAEPVVGAHEMPRMRVLREQVGDTLSAGGKVLVWARFRPEIGMIVRALREEHGHAAVVEYHGDTAQDARWEAVQRFQGDDACRIFVGQPRCAGIGLTLTAASTVIYYSNDYSLEARLQSEDRAHRIGTTGHVVYIDLVAEGTIDERVVKALRTKRDLAATLTGDELREWI